LYPSIPYHTHTHLYIMHIWLTERPCTRRVSHLSATPARLPPISVYVYLINCLYTSHHITHIYILMQIWLTGRPCARRFSHFSATPARLPSGLHIYIHLSRHLPIFLSICTASHTHIHIHNTYRVNPRYALCICLRLTRTHRKAVRPSRLTSLCNTRPPACLYLYLSI